MDIKEAQQLAKALGRLGGLKTSKLYGKDHYRNMQKLGVQTKLAKKIGTN